MSVRFTAVTHAGAVRDNNEDTYIADEQLGLFMVADGMGGHKAGEVASAVAVYTTHEFVANGETLAEAIQRSHNEIVTLAKNNCNSMGSTGVAAMVDATQYEINWVGDSRAYRYSFSGGQSKIERLTQDHSFVQSLIDAGSISEDEARSHPQRNVITQCLGNQMQTEVKVGHTSGRWRPEQWLILCSDGLTGELTDPEIQDLLADCQTIEAARDALLSSALSNGGNDNITLVIIESPRQPSMTQALFDLARSMFLPSNQH